MAVNSTMHSAAKSEHRAKILRNSSAHVGFPLPDALTNYTGALLLGGFIGPRINAGAEEPKGEKKRGEQHRPPLQPGGTSFGQEYCSLRIQHRAWG